MLKTLNRFEQVRLDSMEFECPRCEDHIKYAEASSHVGKCMSVIYSCPMQCGVGGLNTEEQLQDHLQACQNLLRRCDCCPVNGNITILRDEEFQCPRKLQLVAENIDCEDT